MVENNHQSWKDTTKLDYSDTHRVLVEGCQRNDAQAQFQLYQHYSQAMYNICLRMLNSDVDAEDILQNSFVDVFRKINMFRFDSSIGAWIKRIVINNCINHLKRRRLKTEEWLEHKGEHLLVLPVGLEDTPEYNIDEVHEAIKNLPDGYRIVFNLYCLEGYDHQEISEILGISEATSKSQYSRAKKKLREGLSSAIRN